MSDPVTNLEIEDVLSSIRKLVSEDNRPVASTDAPAQTQDDEPSETVEKLVLTPAFRVAEPACDPQDNADHSADTQMSEAEPETVAEVPNTEAQWSKSEEDDRADHQSSASESAPFFHVSETTPEDIADEFGDHRDADWFGADTDEPSVVKSTNELEKKIAELEAAVGQQVDQSWEPEEGDAPIKTDGASEEWEDVQAAFGDAENSAEGAEEAQAPDVDAFDPDAPVEIPAFLADRPKEERAQDAKASTDETVDLSEEDTILDEDTLRDLVSEIVRDELQGAMGERITRNVRKLVRREIHRILASQDFD